MEYYNKDLYVIPRCVFSLTELAKRLRGRSNTIARGFIRINLGQLRNEYAAKFFTKSHNPKNYVALHRVSSVEVKSFFVHYSD